MKLSILALVLTLFVVSIATAQKDDKRKSTSGVVAGPAEGVVYALPQTGIRVHVKATRERYVHGPYSGYAQKMLGIDNVPSTDADHWNMDEIQIEVFSEPDPEQVYKATGHAAQIVSLTESGILAGINSGVENQESAIQTSSFPMKKPDKQVKFTDLSIWSFYSPVDSTRKVNMV